MGYRAFFSYARADDRIANWLHRQLDGYRTPRPLVGVEGELGPVPPKLHPIFRDRTDLEAGGHVDSALQQALENSDTLVVLCTPTSAKSHWVNHECETFLRLGREDHIFPVIASGEPGSGNPDTECFPPALQGKGLLAADLREIKKPTGQLVGDGKESGRLKLIAGLLGVPLDALVQRERRRQRQLLAVLSAAALTFLGVAIFAGFQTVLAQRNEREAQLQSASVAVGAARGRLTEGDLDGALLLLLSASRVYEPDQAPENLLIAFDETLRRAAVQTDYSLPSGATLFASRNGWLIADARGQIQSLEGSAPPTPFASAGGPVSFLGVEGDGSVIAVRRDLVIERLRRNGVPDRLGAFEPVGEGWEFIAPFQLAADGTLMMEPERLGTLTQVFDTQSRRLYRLQIPSRFQVSYGVSPGSGRVLFNADAVVPLETGQAGRATMYGQLLFNACSAGATVDRYKDAFIAAIGEPVSISCTSSGERITLHTYQLMAGSPEREDFVFDGRDLQNVRQWLLEQLQQDAVAGFVDGELRGNYLNVDLDAVRYDYETGRLAVASARDLLVMPAFERVDDPRREWRFPDRIRDVQFLDGNHVAAAYGEPLRISVMELGSQNEFGARVLEEGEARPPLLHDRICDDAERQVVDDGRLAIRWSDYNTRVALTLTQHGQSRALTRASQEQSCVMLSASGRYLAVLDPDGAVIYDLKSAPGPSLTEVGRFRVSELYFLGNGPSFMAINWETGALSRWTAPPDDDRGARWRHQDISTAFVSGEPDRTGDLIIGTEDLGHNNVGVVLYSLSARRDYRRLGACYRNAEAHFARDGDVVLTVCEAPAELITTYDLADAVQRARAELSQACLGFSGDEYQRSPCWPTN